MERRLLIARDLLKSTGVIIVAIGDEEHHRLRMLLDHVFSPDNFLANIVWASQVQMSRSTSAVTPPTGHPIGEPWCGLLFMLYTACPSHMVEPQA